MPRHVDAAIISAGVNNIAFGPLMETCTISAGLLEAATDRDTVSKLAGTGRVSTGPSSSSTDGKGWITKFRGPIDPSSTSKNIGTKNDAYRAKPTRGLQGWQKGKGRLSVSGSTG